MYAWTVGAGFAAPAAAGDLMVDGEAAGEDELVRGFLAGELIGSLWSFTDGENALLDGFSLRSVVPTAGARLRFGADGRERRMSAALMSMVLRAAALALAGALGFD